jgi:hypothetical protein
MTEIRNKLGFNCIVSDPRHGKSVGRAAIIFRLLQFLIQSDIHAVNL